GTPNQATARLRSQTIGSDNGLGLDLRTVRSPQLRRSAVQFDLDNATAEHDPHPRRAGRFGKGGGEIGAVQMPVGSPVAAGGRRAKRQAGDPAAIAMV